MTTTPHPVAASTRSDQTPPPTPTSTFSTAYEIASFNAYTLPQASAGFVVVTNVDMDHATLTLLAPCSGELPTNHLLLGKIEWMEGNLA